VAEETGLDVQPYAMFEIFERIMPDADGKPEYHYVLIDYLCRRIAGQAVAASDASRVEWVAEQNLRAYRLTEGTLDVIERAFAKLQR
jgi:8-oxo-dGTP diphosphatase